MSNNKPKPMTKEEQAKQIARYLAQKKEQYFQIILSNTIQGRNLSADGIKEAVDAAWAGSDYILGKFVQGPDESKEGEQ